MKGFANANPASQAHHHYFVTFATRDALVTQSSFTCDSFCAIIFYLLILVHSSRTELMSVGLVNFELLSSLAWGSKQLLCETTNNITFREHKSFIIAVLYAHLRNCFPNLPEPLPTTFLRPSTSPDRPQILNHASSAASQPRRVCRLDRSQYPGPSEYQKPFNCSS